MHLTADLLALLALGEDVATPEQHHHLAGCEHCAAELASLAEVVTVGRSLDDTDALVAPDPEVWQRIQAQTRAEPPTGVGPTGAPTGVPDDHPQDARLGPAAPDGPPRRRRRTAVALAAAVALVAGIGIGVGASRLSQPGLELLAETPLASVNEKWPDATGVARLEVGADGQRELVLQVDPGTPIPQWREVWLVDEDFERMVSLGTMDTGENRYSVPTALDVAEYPWVDVSVEPDDGVSAHSGDSMVRGELPH